MKVLLISPSFDTSRYMRKPDKIVFVFHPRSKDIVQSASAQSVVKDFRSEVVGITCVRALVPGTIECRSFSNSSYRT